MAYDYSITEAGNTTIMACSREFKDGHCYGYLSFYDTRKRPEFPLVEKMVVKYILEFADSCESPEWRAGAILGWIEGVLENDEHTFTSLLPDIVQIGANNE